MPPPAVIHARPLCIDYALARHMMATDNPPLACVVLAGPTHGAPFSLAPMNTVNTTKRPVAQQSGVDAANPRDRGLLERAVSRYHAALMSFLRWKLGSDQDAQDAAQDTYTRLLKYRETEQEDLPRALVMRIATHVVIDRKRQDHVRQSGSHVPLEEDLPLESAEAQPDQHIAHQQELEAVKRAMLRLPPRCREAFVLSRVKGMSNPQIAQELGITPKAVERLITKALHRLRTRVGRQEP